MIIVVRHGRTAANAAGLLQGRMDPPLDEVGERQAACVGTALAGAARVVVSPLARARATGAALGLPVEVDERWVELDYGEWDGRPLTEVPRDTWAQWRNDPSFTPPGGESMAALSARVTAACEELVDEARDHDVVVVSHVTPIKAVLCWALRVGVDVGWRTYLDHASITRVGIGPHGPVLRGFNDTAHLR